MPRYSRNIMLPEIGEEGQRRLARASVLIVGCGALGTVCAMQLAGTGVGRIGLVDFDTVDISNLQRQIVFTTADVGKKKAQTLAERIHALNPDIQVDVHDLFLSGKKVIEVIAPYDVIIEGSDNPDTKYLLSQSCRETGKPCCMGGIFGTNGQALTFVPGHASYSDFFPVGASAGGFTPCALGGVLGPLPGIIGSIQSTEVIKLIVGFGEPLVDRLLTVDASTMTFRTFSIANSE